MIDVRRIDANDKPVNTDGTHIIYWMTSARRARWNHALDHAIELANEHNVPLIVVECLALGHRWANDRIHTFVLQGMIDNRKLFESSAVTYVPYVETKKAQAKGLLHSFSRNAVAVVIDAVGARLGCVLCAWTSGAAGAGLSTGKVFAVREPVAVIVQPVCTSLVAVLGPLPRTRAHPCAVWIVTVEEAILVRVHSIKTQIGLLCRAVHALTLQMKWSEDVSVPASLSTQGERHRHGE